jgi:hypothetical protein
VRDLTEEINRLRGRLAAVTDDREREEITAELGRLNHEKVLAPRAGWDPDAWAPIPEVEYVRPTVEGDALRDAVKAFFWFVVLGLDDFFGPTQREFVSLFALRRSDDDVRLALICPYREPLDFVLQQHGSGLDPDFADRITGWEVEHRYTLVEELLIPIVFVYDGAARHVLLMNKHHFHNPEQFLSPRLCRTTSGFLNFIGAQVIRESPTVLVSDIESIMNEGLDEWFRWLYCMFETGRRFESKRLLVMKANPEEYAYDYDGE